MSVQQNPSPSLQAYQTAVLTRSGVTKYIPQSIDEWLSGKPQQALIDDTQQALQTAIIEAIKTWIQTHQEIVGIILGALLGLFVLGS